MGLVRNLKKTLSSLAEKILVELCYQYIKQAAKQTSKKPASYLQTMYSQNRLTMEAQRGTIATSLAGTSEKIIMEKTIEPVKYAREWSIDRIHELAEGDLKSQFDAVAIAEEFDEWIHLPEGPNYLQCLVLERPPGFGDQEIDILDK
jgi:hypothetical protein